MSETGTLTLSFSDVYGNKPKDRVDIFLRHTTLSHAPIIRNQKTNNTIHIKDLSSAAGGTYSLLVYPTNYRTNSRFVSIKEDKDTPLDITLAVLPEKVSQVKFPAYDSLPEQIQDLLKNSNVEGFLNLQGAELYQALDDIRRAGLLNIATKMRYTTFDNERSVFSYMNSLRRLRGDRFFVEVDRELRDAVKNSLATDLFHKVNGGLHTPPPGYELTDSFKTHERYGNLQLTFFGNPQTLEFIVDADIDDAQGIEHIFQVLGNIGGGSTHPYNIHEILVSQHIDPGYSFVF